MGVKHGAGDYRGEKEAGAIRDYRRLWREKVGNAGFQMGKKKRRRE